MLPTIFLRTQPWRWENSLFFHPSQASLHSIRLFHRLDLLTTSNGSSFTNLVTKSILPTPTQIFWQYLLPEAALPTLYEFSSKQFIVLKGLCHKITNFVDRGHLTKYCRSSSGGGVDLPRETVSMAVVLIALLSRSKPSPDEDLQNTVETSQSTTK